MITLSEIVLVVRNARDKIQVAIASLSQEGNTFLINRTTGQYQGKMTSQPVLIIEKGKAKRSVLQQAEQEFNSIVNKYMDKGYKRLDTLSKKKFNDIKEKELEELVPTSRTDSSGEVKPMLAKDFNKCQNSVFQKPMWASKKLNGVRMACRKNQEKKRVVTISRGGKNYDISSQKITRELLPLFETDVYKDIILDGELYIHGVPLQTISGIARLETWDERCDRLEYWIYDIIDERLTFDKRNEILLDLEDFFEDSKKIKVLRHVKTECWNDIQRLHDKYVAEGFEGVVVRKPDKVYEPGKRTSTMIKIKAYQEDSFRITGYSEKLRDEDFCFTLETKEGKPFEAKPIGTREIKDEYLNNMDDIIGRLGDVKFFEWSKDKIPLQPVFIAVRYDLE